MPSGQILGFWVVVGFELVACVAGVHEVTVVVAPTLGLWPIVIDCQLRADF